MSGLKILVAGGGIAGPAVGFWLSNAGAEVTIIERAPSVRTAGQNIDIRGAAREVVRRMGLEELLMEHHTTERGMAWVDEKNNYIAPFPASKKDEVEGFTAELEILRCDLAKIMYDATKDKTKWIFDDCITGIEELGGKTKITMAKGSTQEYDVVIIADGLGSKTRSILIPEFGEQWIHRTGMYMAFFSVPKGKTDTDWCRWYTPPGRKSIMLRPDNHDKARIVLAIMNGDPRLEEVLGKPQSEQKALMRELFAGSGWETERLLDGMDNSDDYYMDKTAQTRLPFWSRGRCVLLGDAAYGPSPLTGMGTSLALIGAYILSHEILLHPANPQEAFDEYDRKLRPFVTKAQKIIPGAPGLIHPQSWWGVRVMYAILSFLSWEPVRGMLFRLSGPPADKFTLPDYEEMKA